MSHWSVSWSQDAAKMQKCESCISTLSSTTDHDHIYIYIWPCRYSIERMYIVLWEECREGRNFEILSKFALWRNPEKSMVLCCACDMDAIKIRPHVRECWCCFARTFCVPLAHSWLSTKFSSRWKQAGPSRGFFGLCYLAMACCIPARFQAHWLYYTPPYKPLRFPSPFPSVRFHSQVLVLLIFLPSSFLWCERCLRLWNR